MADELTISAGLTLETATLTVVEEPGQQEIDFAGSRYSGGVQDIGNATHELLVTGADFGTAGWGWFHNLDAAINIDLGIDSGGTFHAMSTVFPGERFPMPLKTKAIYAKAASGTAKLKYTILER